MGIENVFKDMENALRNMFDELEPVPYDAAVADCEIITFDGTERDNTQWLALIETHIETAETFEIHCWTEEKEEISLALQFGAVKPDQWKYGTIITGSVTEEFKDWLLHLPKPTDRENGYNKMTPFFSIMFDNGFSSEHYGTENIIRRA